MAALVGDARHGRAVREAVGFFDGQGIQLAADHDGGAGITKNILGREAFAPQVVSDCGRGVFPDKAPDPVRRGPLGPGQVGVAVEVVAELGELVGHGWTAILVA